MTQTTSDQLNAAFQDLAMAARHTRAHSPNEFGYLLNALTGLRDAYAAACVVASPDQVLLEQGHARCMARLVDHLSASTQ